jgi:hypothetical protein
MTNTDFSSMQEELEHYRAEREKIRTLVGQIGGAAGSKLDRTLNILFIFLVVGLFTVDILQYLHAIPQMWPPELSVELALLLVSVKIIWMIYQQSRVEHFQFWILNSIEFRLTDLGRRLHKIEAGLEIGEKAPDA